MIGKNANFSLTSYKNLTKIFITRYSIYSNNGLSAIIPTVAISVLLNQLS